MGRAIVAIGGGEIRTRGTTDIDREIIRLSNREHPKILFIPTASSDSEEYCGRFAEHFGNFLKCKTDVLFLIDAPPSTSEIEQKILSADIVYVGGGNTLYMMRVWRRLGVDKLLRAAYADGIILAGISAGAICWFDSGHSDSMSFYNPGNWEYINVKGLGLIGGVHPLQQQDAGSSEAKSFPGNDSQNWGNWNRAGEQLRYRVHRRPVLQGYQF